MKPETDSPNEGMGSAAPVSSEQADALLQEMAQLYRDRLRALYNTDPDALKSVNARISDIKIRLGSDY